MMVQAQMASMRVGSKGMPVVGEGLDMKEAMLGLGRKKVCGITVVAAPVTRVKCLAERNQKMKRVTICQT